MSPILISYFAGMASAFGISTAFVLFCMRFAKRAPGPEQFEHVSADEFSPPAYWRRGAR